MSHNLASWSGYTGRDRQRPRHLLWRLAPPGNREDDEFPPGLAKRAGRSEAGVGLPHWALTRPESGRPECHFPTLK
jgi:hypothetical protein